MNNVCLVARLVRDPELKTSQSGTDVVKFAVAVNRNYRDKETDQYEAAFPICVAFGKTAGFISKYFSKGQRIGIVGHLQTGKYEHKDGYTVYTTEVVVDRAHFVESKQSQPEPESRQEQMHTPEPEPEPHQIPLPEPEPEDPYGLPFDM